MKIIGCDFHPGFQQISIAGCGDETKSEEETPSCLGRSRAVVPQLAGAACARGHRGLRQYPLVRALLQRLGHELVVGDAARIRAAAVRRQKKDERGADHLLELLESGRFPAIWVPSPEERDSRQLLLHRNKLVQMRTRIKNQLQHVALDQGLQKKRQLWTGRGRQWLLELSLPPWTERRRSDLLNLLDGLEPAIAEFSQAVERAAQQDPRVQLLQTHPGVGPITHWLSCYLLFISPVHRPQTSGLRCAYQYQIWS